MTTEISVIIPTGGRIRGLARSLAALDRQTLAREKFEAIVIVDGADAATLDWLRSCSLGFRLKFKGVPPAGAGPARNCGAALAAGRRLLFLDDDIEAAPNLLEAHLKAAERRDCVGIGNLLTEIPDDRSWLGQGMRVWWERKFQDMRSEGHRFNYVDLLSGHFSISAEAFLRIGGFDSSLACREDYEFGIRLIRAAIPFVFVKDSAAIHHETVSLRKNLNRAMSEGFADVVLARRHPELIPTLLAFKYCCPRATSSRSGQWVESFIKMQPNVAEYTLNLLERAGMRGAWQRLYLGLRRYWYLKGVVAACPDVGERQQIFRELTVPARKAPPMLELDGGIDGAAAMLGRDTFTTVRITHGAFTVGIIKSEPFSEPLQPDHLLPFIRNYCAPYYVAALALQRIAKGPR